MHEPRQHAVDLPGLRAGVLEWGPPDGPLLVALHGFPDSAWTWRSVAPLLADAGWRVVAPFLRGYAPTGLPDDRDHSVLAVAQDAVHLHTALGGDERAVLVGHDWGAIAATTLAGRDDAPFARYAALAVPPLALMGPSRQALPTWLRAVARQPFRSWYIAVNQVPGLSERRFHSLARRLWSAWSPGYDATTDLALLAEAVPDRDHAAAAVGYYRSLIRPGTRATFATPLRPVLHLLGAQDGCLDPRFLDVVAPRLAAPSRASLVDDAGHFLQLEQPEVVGSLVLDFVGRPAHEQHGDGRERT